MWQKKRVWQVTTIIQLALCHLVTSHFQEIACNYTPKGQIRWPIFLLLLCMIVLTEITSKFPKPIIFRILVFSCHKMTLITIFTRMPLLTLGFSSVHCNNWEKYKKTTTNHQETKPSANPFASKGANPFQENQANPFHWGSPLHGCEPLVVSPTAVFPNYFILVWQHIPCLIFLFYQGCEQIVNFFTSYFSGWSSSNLCRSWFSQKLLHFFCVLLNNSPCI